MTSGKADGQPRAQPAWSQGSQESEQCPGSGPGSRQVATSGKQVRAAVTELGQPCGPGTRPVMAGVHVEPRTLAWSSLKNVHMRPLVEPLVKTGPKHRPCG